MVVGVFIKDVESISINSNWFLYTFFFEFEKNAPSLFSSFILLIAGLLMRFIATKQEEIEKGLSSFWKILGGIFIFLAADEWFSLHEILNQFGNYSFPSWVVFYVPLASVIALFCIKPLFKLPSKIRTYLIIAGTIYGTGAVLFELISAKVGLFKFNDIYYQVFLFFEDGLEMAGVMLLIFTLILYLKQQYQLTKINIPIRGFSILLGLTLIESIITYSINNLTFPADCLLSCNFF